MLFYLQAELVSERMQLPASLAAVSTDDLAQGLFYCEAPLCSWYNEMWTAGVWLCLLATWCAGAGAHVPPPCASEYHLDGRVYHCGAGVDECRTEYVKQRFVYNPDRDINWDEQEDERCSLCLPSYCCHEPASPGVCSDVQLNGSLEFFGFISTYQGWERLTFEDWIIVLPASPLYSLYYPNNQCPEWYENYEHIPDSLCPDSAFEISTCPEGEQVVHGTCMRNVTIGRNDDRVWVKALPSPS